MATDLSKSEIVTPTGPRLGLLGHALGRIGLRPCSWARQTSIVFP